ncbi:MAG: hypothetical protein HOV73_01905 [Streptomyces sp.]|nr:hypothetical protein [Streptomyces sp.]
MTALLEISAHTIGGPDTYPRNWGPSVVHVDDLDQLTHIYTSLTSDVTAALELRCELTDWLFLGGDWSSAHASLYDVNGWTIGRRPALIYTRPYAIASVTPFYLPKEDMVFNLLTRTV